MSLRTTGLLRSLVLAAAGCRTLNLPSGGVADSADVGLVAHWTFDAGRGGIAGTQEVQPGGFCYPFKSCRGPKPFTAKAPFWMTFHWLRFRATGPTAILTISDWASPGDPGGPVGQQTMANFVEVQPVLEAK